MEKKVVIITGVSTGIGRETCLYLNKKGFSVYGTSRNPDKLNDLINSNINVLKMDFSDIESMKNVIDNVLDVEGKIDCLVNNAGFGFFGAIEKVDMQRAKELFEVNLFGLVEFTKLVISHMIKSRRGKIINVVSLASEIILPTLGWYSASKSGLETITQTLRLELRSFGIDVVSIWPPATKTNWFDNAISNSVVSQNGNYLELFKKSVQMFKWNEIFSISPKLVAKLISKVIESKRTKPRYVVSLRGKFILTFYRIIKKLGIFEWYWENFVNIKTATKKSS